MFVGFCICLSVSLSDCVWLSVSVFLCLLVCVSVCFCVFIYQVFMSAIVYVCSSIHLSVRKVKTQVKTDYTSK